MVYSVFDLAFTYIQRFYKEEPSKEEKIQIIRDFDELLYNGWTAEDIVKHLRAFIAKYPGQRPEILKLFSKLYPSSRNLLIPGTIYYHNQLRVMPGPPVRELDYNSGEITKKVEPYFLEIRASYTIDDLVDFFIEQFHLEANIDDRKRYIGGFKYLLKTYNIDTVLFMVDVASNLMFTEDRNRRDYNPLNLSDYRTKAEENLTAKQTELRLMGDDKIVPRKRVFTFGSGDTI